MYSYEESKQKYEDVALHTMQGNFQGDTPFFIRRYSKNALTHVRHRHEMMQINYMVKGVCRHSIGEREGDVVKGDLLIVPPYIPHQINCSESSDFEMYEIEFTEDFIIHNAEDFEQVQSIFDFAYLEPFLISEDRLNSRYHLSVEDQKKAEHFLAVLQDEYTQRDHNYMLMIKGVLLQMLVLFQRALTDEASQALSKEAEDSYMDAMEKAIQYVDEHYMENISSQHVAQIAAFSKSYFGYLFKAVTHKTFVEYLNEKRIEAAVRMLNETAKRVIDICYDCGFKNISHFNRTFKAAVGVSPTEYRSAVRKGKSR